MYSEAVMLKPINVSEIFAQDLGQDRPVNLAMSTAWMCLRGASSGLILFKRNPVCVL